MMLISEQPGTGRTRRGTIVPYLALTLVGLVGFLALAIDLGMLAVAKTQAQNAADLAALTAMRSATGDPTSTYNSGTATTNAQNILSYNSILGTAITSSQVTLTYGSYDYSQSSQTFSANYPPTAGKPYTAATATVTANNLSGAFSNVFGTTLLPGVSATAQAVHRPRDLALVVDLSGSMRFGTCLGYDFYTNTRITNNADSVYPAFSHYSAASSLLQGSGANRTSAYDNYTISSTNTTAPTSSFALTYINNFYQNAAYATPLVRAFDSYSSGDGGTTWAAPTTQRPQLPPSTYATTPGGDVPLFKSGSTTTYAQNVNDVIGGTPNVTNALWELDGYSAYASGKPDTSNTGSTPQVWTQADYGSTPFNGYTQGPGYYGKTFFLWPPDPRTQTALSGATLTSYLAKLGVTNATDQTTLSSIWSTWQGQGAAGLSNLQKWLQMKGPQGASQKSTVDYTTVFIPGVTTWNGSAVAAANKPQTYYAVCRLFNRAYPAGTAAGAFDGDWRQRFFGTTDNTKLFGGSGSLAMPSGSTYTINYSAILTWIAGGQDPFPSQLRAGRIKYYGAIPTSITGTWPSYGNTDQQFWKEVIDYTLGLRQTGATTYTDVSAMAGYGRDFTWGTMARNGAPAAPQSVNYADNPLRPLLRFWFGPLAMTDYLNSYNMAQNASGYYFMQPGDSYEAPVYPGKQAFLGAVSTMENNHPNDWFALAAYSWPRGASNGTASGGSGFGRFNCVRAPMGTNYDYAKAALLFPFSTINADGSCNNTEITPYDKDSANSNAVPSANFVDTPRADGDTCFAMGLMLAYNQFATTATTDGTLRSYVTNSPITFPTGMAGGLGRKGAQKVVIFETDGLANASATAPLVNAGSYSYYQVRYDMNKPTSSEFPIVSVANINNAAVLSQVYSIVDQLKTDYGTTRNPFRLYTIGFGPVFQGPDASSALTTLQTMQYHAGTQSSPSTALSPSQIVTGTDKQMSANMVSAFTTILQSGVQIALIK